MVKDEIKELIDKLNYYTKKYDEGQPEISDKEWDDMYFQLQTLENSYGIYYEDSPTQKVNFQIVNKLNKIEHNHKMLSLDKTKSIDEVENFLGEYSYLAMLKMDGLTCSLRYVDGKLVSAETRGNGLIGEDILHNALVVKNIPNKINYREELIVDGEIICKYDDFKEFENEYANPRNFASGSIRLLDAAECSKRNLSFVAWEVVKGFEKYNTFSDRLNSLDSLGFTVVDNCSINDISSDIDLLKFYTEKHNYPIDGIVFKFNDIKYGKSLGETGHHFKNAIAYKFYDEEYPTTLIDIEYTMGRTGQLTPVAVFQPINIEGSTVERASLHNISVMESLNIYFKGQRLYILKANQIIPQVSRAEDLYDDLSEIKYEYLHLPDKCPICGEAAEIKDNDGVKTLWCGNPHCSGKLINRIEHFFSKKGLDTKGISKATIEKLIDWGWVKSISDVFELSKYEKEWKNKSGFGDKSVDNILDAIKESCNASLETVISAAGIPLIGKTVAKDLAKRFNSYEDFREAIKNNFDFTQFDGYGYERYKAINEFDYSELDNIVEKYLTIEKNNDIINIQKLNDLTFCVTGKVNLWKNRIELSEFIESLGGKITSSVSKKTNYLINNDTASTSAKNLKAKELNIPIISEEEFKKFFDIK
jgi:DNA ligase (NAD+)